MIQKAPRKKPAEKIMKLYEQKGERDGITKGLAAIAPLAAIELRLRIPCITSQKLKQCRSDCCLCKSKECMLHQCSSRQTLGESERHKTRVLKSPRKHPLNESLQAMGQLVTNMKVGCKTGESTSYLACAQL